MPDYDGFYLRSNSSVVRLEMLEFSHSSFTQTYRVVRNYALNGGLSVTVENGTQQFFEYYPLTLDHGEDTDDLDKSLQVTFGDLGEILPKELDRVIINDSHAEKPSMIYRAYRSDDLSGPMEGPNTLEVTSMTPGNDSVTFVCSAPALNSSRSGETYSYTRFPMLNGIN